MPHKFYEFDRKYRIAGFLPVCTTRIIAWLSGCTTNGGRCFISVRRRFNSGSPTILIAQLNATTASGVECAQSQDRPNWVSTYYMEWFAVVTGQPNLSAGGVQCIYWN